MKQLPDITSSFNGRTIVQIHRRPVTAQRDDVIPFKLNSFVPEDHLIRKGFPYVPDLWVKTTTMASAVGVVYDENASPWDITIPGQHTRFLFNSTLWDSTSGVLRPFFTEGIDYSMVGSQMTQPRLEDIEYRIGKKLIDVSTLRFDPESSLHSNFNMGMDDASIFTIGLVCRVYGTEKATLMRIGEGAYDATEILVGERIQVTNGQTQVYIDTPKNPGAVSPLFIFITNTPSKTVVTVGMEGHLYQHQFPSRDVPRKLVVTFGEGLGGDVNLMANIFDFFICSEEVSHRELSALMSTVYR